jgi:phenylacetic acid degradation operon negative regulatory protein
VLDLFGSFVRPLGGWIANTHLLTLLGELDVEERSGRSAVLRMRERDLLVASKRDGVLGYEPSDEANRILEEGDERIFKAQEPARIEDGWVVVAFSVPESERELRHLIRSRLVWLGFGNLAPGVWLAPRRLAPMATEMLSRLGLEEYVSVFEASYLAFGDVADMVARGWDLDGLRALYDEFLVEQRPVLTRWRRGRTDDLRAFVDYTTATHQWRKLPYLDPGLPVEVLPTGWEGRTANSLFLDLVGTLRPAALAHVREVVAQPPRRRRTAS